MKEFGQKYATHEIDIATDNLIIECKTNLNNRSASDIIQQIVTLDKYSNNAQEIIIYSGKGVNYELGSIMEISKELNSLGIKFKIIDNQGELLNYIK